MHSIPPEFAHRMIEMSGDAGREWLNRLPTTLDEYAQRWSLTIGPPFELSYNYVAPATRSDGVETVIKLGIPNRELLSELHALQVYNGRGIVQLLEVDFEHQVFFIRTNSTGCSPGQPGR